MFDKLPSKVAKGVRVSRITILLGFILVFTLFFCLLLAFKHSSSLDSEALLKSSKFRGPSRHTTNIFSAELAAAVGKNELDSGREFASTTILPFEHGYKLGPEEYNRNSDEHKFNGSNSYPAEISSTQNISIPTEIPFVNDTVADQKFVKIVETVTDSKPISSEPVVESLLIKPTLKPKQKLAFNFYLPSRGTEFPTLRTIYSSQLLSKILGNNFGNPQLSGNQKYSVLDNDGSVEKVRILHRALRTGEVCMPLSNEKMQSRLNPTLNSHQEVIDRLVAKHPYKSYIEYSSMPVEETLAQYVSEVSHYNAYAESGKVSESNIQLSDTTVLLIHVHDRKQENLFDTFDSGPKSDAQASPLPLFCPSPVASNMLVSQVSFTQVGNDDGSSVGGKLTSLFGMFDCLQLVQDLSFFIGERLAVEYERAFGEILCRCNDTVIPKTLPDDAFFASWESTESLVEASGL